MTWRPPQWLRYRRIFGSDPAADVDDELRFHLDSKVDDLVAQGWSPEAARQEAERQFGDVTRLRKMGEQLGQSHERRRRLTAFAREAPRR
ncbi:MAG: hypothetical protein EHM55_00525 [Acidobacteria bacterium]|nr:MAG: hypothetical protein EHM55_00525 [Acidobacteriota bacterium]